MPKLTKRAVRYVKKYRPFNHEKASLFKNNPTWAHIL